MPVTTLLVRRNQLGTTRVGTRDYSGLIAGEIRVRIDSLALTANNITSAALGDAMNYWQFFPTGEDGWGIVPAWGFGSVVQSLHPDVPVGERLYGIWPMASEAVLRPRDVQRHSLVDAAPRRTAPRCTRLTTSIPGAVSIRFTWPLI